jgi:hypothetical protein
MKTPPESPDQSIKRRVAVIAVHGVGDPGAGSTAQSITILLSRLFHKTKTGNQTAYTPFTSSGLTISNRPASRTTSRHQPSVRSIGSAGRHLGGKDVYAVDGDPILFIGSQLNDYKMEDDDRTYVTTVHEGYRRNPLTGEKAIKIDVYELYWADLIRISSGVFGFFTDLYQLIFHVTHLSSKSVTALRKNIPGENTWDWLFYDFFTTVAARYLAIMVFFYNVWLLPVVIVISLLLTARINGVAMLCLALVAAAAALAVHSWASPALGKWKTQIGITILCGMAVGVFGLEGVLRKFESEASENLSATLLLLVFSGLIVAFINRFDASTPNSRFPALIVGGAVWGLWLAPLFLDSVPIHWSLQTLYFLSVLADGNYAMLLAWEALALGAGLLTWFRARGSKHADPIRRVFFTSLLGLGFPTVLFSLTTIPIWTVFVKGILPSALGNLHLDFFTNVLLQIASVGFGAAALLTSLALVLVVTLLFPSILAEVPVFKSNVIDAKRLARWLTSGAVSVPVMTATIFFAAAIPVAFIIFFAVTGKVEFSSPEVMGILAFFGITVLVLKDRAGDWTAAFGPILNKALDVDGYLRQNPKERTPKARIFCRYVSLLRYVFCHPAKYDEVVILCHSQGTIVTADLLKYLMDKKVKLDPVLLKEKIPGREFLKDISVFTMGCPLRQLYSERFPAWYDWARSTNVDHRPAHPAAPALSDDILPLQSIIGVKRWSNAYGASDYIGRALWRGVEDNDFADLPSQRPSWDVDIPVDSSTKTSGTCREFCIGPFAHTRYWDEQGDAVARELDDLIG